MRRRFKVPLIFAVAALPWVWFLPAPPPPDQPARLVAVLDIDEDAEWVGGLSGIDVDAEGASFYMVSDNGHLAKGQLLRENGALFGIVFDRVRLFFDQASEIANYPNTDAEGVAVDSSGRVFVSFERAHRVLVYDTWVSLARWPSYTHAWRALARNGGLEAIAVTDDGMLLTVPEKINAGATEALIYTRVPGTAWEQRINLPVDEGLSPVGADFGPDGRLYVLERGLYPFGFYSRVRSMIVNDDGVHDVQTLLHTRLARHGNLEGLAVWRDSDGFIRLTMVSDDNYYGFMRGQIVEYVVDHGVALKAQ